MSPRSTALSLTAIASFFASSIALPFEVPHLLPRYSIVNVDGSSSPTTASTPAAVTQTIVSTVSAPGTTSVTIVNVDSATEIVYVTVVPTSVAPTLVAPTSVAPTSVAPTSVAPTSVAPTSVAPTPTPSAPLPPTIPYGYGSPPLNANSTSSSSSLSSTSPEADILPSIATTSTPCEPTPKVVGDRDPWRHGHHTTPTGTYPTAPATSGYDASAAARPSGMTAPLPVLPPTTPYFLNITEVPKVRRRVVVARAREDSR